MRLFPHPRRLSAALLSTAIIILLTGCLQRQLLRLEISQRQDTLQEMGTTSAYLETSPELSAGYDGKVFISEASLNDFLSGMDGYEIPLESPKKATITLERTRLDFKDGSSDVSVEATARREGWPVSVKLRIDAQLVVTVNPEGKHLEVGFRVKKILPDVRLSIFRFREWWFSQSLMRVKSQSYFDTLPKLKVELKPEFEIDLKRTNESVVDTNKKKGWIKLRTKSPGVHLKYKYVPLIAAPLDDGLHVFLKLERTFQ